MSHEEWLDRCPVMKYRPMGLSMKRLALALGVSTTTLDKYRGGTSMPSRVRMENISVLFKVPFNELMTEWNEWRHESNG
jgi:transcriptional regulator with XRE-family HTH domain